MDKPKSKGGRPKKPPTPPVLGIATRKGVGYELTLVLGGMTVNGKKFDPQTGAELLAEMLAEWMDKSAAHRPAAPSETAVQDSELANPATNGDAAGSIAESGDGIPVIGPARPGVPCNECGGSGEDLEDSSKDCWKCSGTGMMSAPAAPPEVAIAPGPNGHH